MGDGRPTAPGRTGSFPSSGRSLPDWRPRRALIASLLVAGLVWGCFPGPITVPPGGQEVHAVVHGNAVTLEPTTVRAGDVYLVLDVPSTDVVFVEKLTAPDATPGPLSDADLDRLARGDTFHMSLSSGFANGEPYGNVSQLQLAPGKYAFVVGDFAGGAIPPESLAVLEVVP